MGRVPAMYIQVSWRRWVRIPFKLLGPIRWWIHIICCMCMNGYLQKYGLLNPPSLPSPSPSLPPPSLPPPSLPPPSLPPPLSLPPLSLPPLSLPTLSLPTLSLPPMRNARSSRLAVPSLPYTVQCKLTIHDKLKIQGHLTCCTLYIPRPELPW